MKFSTQYTALSTAALLVLALVLAFPVTGRAFDYIDGFDAVPVMDGMAQTDDGSLIFDKPGGRILEATIIGPVDHLSAMRFYDQTLRSLGWSPVGPAATGKAQYAREDEALQIEQLDANGDTTLIFRLNPAPSDR